MTRRMNVLPTRVQSALNHILIASEKVLKIIIIYDIITFPERSTLESAYRLVH